MKIEKLPLLTLSLLLLTSSFTFAKDRDTVLQAKVQEAKEVLLEKDPSMQKWFDDSVGYVLFSSVGKAGFGIGGAYGHGEVFEKGEFIGVAKLSQLSIGFQAGGQAYIEVIFFQKQSNLESFKSSKFAFSAEVSAVAATAGASANAKFENGIAIFTVVKGGLMYEASVGGQKFKFKAGKNEG